MLLLLASLLSPSSMCLCFFGMSSSAWHVGFDDDDDVVADDSRVDMATSIPLKILFTLSLFERAFVVAVVVVTDGDGDVDVVALPLSVVEDEALTSLSRFRFLLLLRFRLLL